MTDADNVSDSRNEIALARLRATRTRYEAELKQSGSRAGKRFAMNQADYAQLKRLQRWETEAGCDPEHFQNFHALAKVLTDRDGSEKDLEKEMREECGNDIDEPVWIAGFIEMALAKFEELESKL